MRNVEKLQPGDAVDQFFLVHKATQGVTAQGKDLSLIHISEPTRPAPLSRMPSSA